MDAEQQLKDLGAQALHDLYQNLTGAKQFVLEQAPDICQQMIAWQVAKGCVALSVFTIAAISLVFFVRGMAKAEAADKPPEPYAAGIAVSVVLLVAGLATSVIEGGLALQAIVAPKLYLLERIAALVKG